MSTTHNKSHEWNFRITEQREILVKSKSENAKKVSVIDLATSIPFPLEIPQEFTIDTLELEKVYLITIKIYTLKNIGKVDEKAVEFFEALDVDQSAEDFFKAYWLYPDKIKFVPVEAEPL